MSRLQFPPALPLILLALATLCFAAGCGAAPAGGASAPSPVTFRVSIVPRDADPRLVDVWVDAPAQNLWSKLPLEMTSAAWQALLNLHLQLPGDAPPDRRPAMLGNYAIVDGRLRFRPQFPLLTGEQYVAEFDPAQIPGSTETTRHIATYAVPANDVEPARVVAMYPTGDELPANHLKFYIVFSTPLQQGNIWDHFTLIDETAGEPVADPLRHTELWSQDGCRLTLWFHPGRQKTGVNLNVEIGPVLEQGHHYTLAISGKWLAQNGARLEAGHRKEFVAGPPEHTQVEPTDWKLTTPHTAGREPLVVRFPKPLDWSLLGRELQVETNSGERLAGDAVVGFHELSWSFTPESDWAAGEYVLAVGGVLEDLAGNSVARPFEVNLQQAPREKIERVRLPFVVRPAK